MDHRGSAARGSRRPHTAAACLPGRQKVHPRRHTRRACPALKFGNVPVAARHEEAESRIGGTRKPSIASAALARETRSDVDESRVIGADAEVGTGAAAAARARADGSARHRPRCRLRAAFPGRCGSASGYRRAPFGSCRSLRAGADARTCASPPRTRSMVGIERNAEPLSDAGGRAPQFEPASMHPSPARYTSHPGMRSCDCTMSKLPRLHALRAPRAETSRATGCRYGKDPPAARRAPHPCQHVK